MTVKTLNNQYYKIIFTITNKPSRIEFHTGPDRKEVLLGRSLNHSIGLTSDLPPELHHKGMQTLFADWHEQIKFYKLIPA